MRANKHIQSIRSLIRLANGYALHQRIMNGVAPKEVMHQRIPLVFLTLSMLACSTAKQVSPQIHALSLPDLDFCQVLYGYQVSPTGELQNFDVLEPLCGIGKPVAIEISREYKMNACQRFWATDSHTPTYRENEQQTVLVGLLAMVHPEDLGRLATKYPTDSFGAESTRSADDSYKDTNTSIRDVCVRMIDNATTHDKPRQSKTPNDGAPVGR
jgi:hypothetical protein